MPSTRRESATFGGGCFWCLEAAFELLRGVESVVSGYAGGQTDQPTYREVCEGRTGHAEVIRVTFDPDVITLRELLDLFFVLHDPTTKNRQGADVGTQYRSIVLYESDEQQRIAQEAMAAAQTSGIWKAPIVTEIVPLERFYPAEAYHQGYYRAHPTQGYCVAVIHPKVAKLRAHYAERLKAETH